MPIFKLKLEDVNSAPQITSTEAVIDSIFPINIITYNCRQTFCHSHCHSHQASVTIDTVKLMTIQTIASDRSTTGGNTGSTLIAFVI